MATAARADAGTVSSMRVCKPPYTSGAPNRTGLAPITLMYSAKTGSSFQAHGRSFFRSSGLANSSAEKIRFLPASPQLRITKPLSSKSLAKRSLSAVRVRSSCSYSVINPGEASTNTGRATIPRPVVETPAASICPARTLRMKSRSSPWLPPE